MTTALACFALTLALAGLTAYGGRCLPRHERPGCLRRTIATRAARALTAAAIAVLSLSPVRRAVVRVRWAWRCRGRPVPGDGERLTRAEIQVLGNLDAGRDVRSRT